MRFFLSARADQSDEALNPRTVLDSKDLIAQGKTDATTPLVVGNTVFDPLVFAPEIIPFTRKQYLFLNAYRLGVLLEEACLKADMDPEAANRFLHKPKTIEWLRDRSHMQHIKTEWEEPARWWTLGHDVLEGKRDLTKAQQIVFQEFGQRIVPKRPDVGHGTTKIEINIDPEAVRNAFVRQEAIDGELA